MQMGLYNNVISRENIDSLVFVLTGMCGVHFRMVFQVRMANELLRYTNPGIADVPKRVGFGSANNLYLTYKREFGTAPGERHQKNRKEGDVGEA